MRRHCDVNNGTGCPPEVTYASSRLSLYDLRTTGASTHLPQGICIFSRAHRIHERLWPKSVLPPSPRKIAVRGLKLYENDTDIIFHTKRFEIIKGWRIKLCSGGSREKYCP